MADESLERAGRQWLEARDVIAGALREWGFTRAEGHAGEQGADGYAAALLARLAAHEPPLLVAYPEELNG